jgi:hypothetical protein
VRQAFRAIFDDAGEGYTFEARSHDQERSLNSADSSRARKTRDDRDQVGPLLWICADQSVHRRGLSGGSASQMRHPVCAAQNLCGERRLVFQMPGDERRVAPVREPLFVRICALPIGRNKLYLLAKPSPPEREVARRRRECGNALREPPTTKGGTTQ